jgi:GNAT superfamily N-acetyltransferase
MRWERELDGAAIRLRGYSATWVPSAELTRASEDPVPAIVAEIRDGQVRRINPRYTSRAAGLWWVEFPETSAKPPATALVAFEAPVVPPGSVVDVAGFTSLGVRNSDQVGAIRWWPSTGEVHQIYVAPENRRQGIGTALITAAWTYARLRGWPPLWGSGQRTDLGEVMVTRGAATGSPNFVSRTQPRTHRLPPMTPAERAAGLDRRLLEPDR